MGHNITSLKRVNLDSGILFFPRINQNTVIRTSLVDKQQLAPFKLADLGFLVRKQNGVPVWFPIGRVQNCIRWRTNTAYSIL